MTGFLSQLVARGLGQADVARPRPVSRFEPLTLADAAPFVPDSVAAGLETADESVAPSVPRAARGRVRVASPPHLVSDEDTAEEPAGRAARPLPTARVEASSLAAPVLTVTPPSQPAPSLTVVVRDSQVGGADATPTLPAAARPSPESLPSAPERVVPETTPASAETLPRPAAPMHGILVQPEIRPLVEQLTSPFGAPTLPPPVAPDPTVHVSIGRLEVRATPPPAPPRPARAAEPGRPVKLDEYLRQRGGRGTP